LLGVSGAGKTTTFKCLTGEEIPSSGRVRVNGFDVTTSSGFN
jgi:ATP-binding cassette subfamily A (ABC1) protein 3